MKLSSRILLSVLMTLTVTAGVRAETAADQILSPFVAQYEQIAQVAMTAVVQLEISPSGSNRTGTVELAFWSSGGRYRLHSTASPELQLIGDSEASYDGEYYRLWLQQGNVLSIQREDYAFPLAAITNPLFLPIDYLTTNFPAPPTSLDGVVLSRLDSVRLAPGEVNELTVEVPAAITSEVYGEFTKVRVFLQPHDGLLVPSEIHQETLDGFVFATRAFSDYKATGEQRLLLPRRVLLKSFDEEGGVEMTAEIRITSLDIDQPLAASQFVIEGNDETRIWDNVGERFVDSWPPD